MKNILVVGAGFSGLSLAFELVKKGFKVYVIDQADRPGGMIQTKINKFGLAEAAANGFLNTSDVENFLKEVQATFKGSSSDSNKRFIFNQHPRRWPLSFFQSLLFFYKLFKIFTFNQLALKPRLQESISDWSLRLFSEDVKNFLVEPSLQGIYAGNINELSAELILNPLLTKKKQKKISSSSLFSAPNGMSDIMNSIYQVLLKQGVVFHFSTTWSQSFSDQHQIDCTVLATSVDQAAIILSQIGDSQAQYNSKILQQAEILPLVSLTAYFRKPPTRFLGFGILFPRSQKIRSLGVLMNDVIFDRKFEYFSQTWILGGALDKKIDELTDRDLICLVQKEYDDVFKDSQKIMGHEIKRWPKGLPHYTVSWNQLIKNLQPMNKIKLHGNYLGQIGLSRILQKSKIIAEEIAASRSL